MALNGAERNAAARALFVGALGLGEDHTDETARKFAIDLMKTRLATRLMVELSTDAYQQQVDAAAVSGNKVFLLELHQCSTTLSHVISEAHARGVPVHCVDGRDGNIARVNAGAMQRRNRHAAIQFTAITGAPHARHPAAKGTLILFGGAHFEGDNGIQNLIQDLPVCMAG